MSFSPRAARGLGLGLVLSALGVMAWALSKPRPARETRDVELGALAAQLEGERGAWRARQAELEQRNVDLEAALATEQELRFAREREWLEFTQLVGSLELASAPPIPEFLERSSATGPDGQASAGAEAASSTSDDAVDVATAQAEAVTRALDERSSAMRALLGALLTAEQVRSLDFKELGRPHRFEGRGVVGPVVANLIDDRGHLVGCLFAERLSIEVSRSARCVTLVLEDGYETRGGVRYPFEVESRPRRAPAPQGDGAEASAGAATEEAGAAPAPGLEPRGVQRIFLSSVDPAPWLEALPELIDEGPLVAPLDDGVYDRLALRLELNELLRKAGTEAGEGWRLHVLGGVQSGVLRDVQLVEHAADGSVVRRLFADRMEVHRSGRGIELVLEKGSQERNGRQAPFLEGRYHVKLPRARADDWIAAGVPGAARTR